MPRFLRAVVFASSVGLLCGCDPPGLVGPDGQVPSDGTGGMGGALTVPREETTRVSRFRRLTHTEWERTVKDLLRWQDAPDFAHRFRMDPQQSGYLFAGNGDALEVDQNLWNSYQAAAVDLAARVALDAERLEAILPEAGALSEDERAASFIEEFGERAHRKPLDAELAEAYFALYLQGRDAYTDQNGFAAGIRLVLEAFLQSPYFLYRTEEGSGEPGEAIELSDHERAVRLSYFLWGTMPDDELMATAAAGQLASTAGVREAAERMIADPRAADLLVHFFERVLEVERYEAISPSSSRFPDVGAELSKSARGETAEFLLSTMYDSSGNLRDLLTSTTTFVDEELGRIYGLDGDFDAAFQRVELDREERRGILTQVGFLAAHATSTQPDPIHRGVFVAKRIACIPISAPPDGIPPLPPSSEDKTNRQLVAEHTEAEGTACRNCHAEYINPFGFAFEHYDAVGAYREMDGDFPVDASAVVWLDDEQVEVSSALDLAEALAGSQQVHDCFSGHLLSYALGRPRIPIDEEFIASLGQRSFDQAVSFRELMVEVAVAIAQMERATSTEEFE